MEQRHAKTRTGLLEDFGMPHEEGYLLEVKPTHQDVAVLMASTRETLTARFNRMKGEGRIDFEAKFVVLLRPERVRVPGEAEA